MVLWCEEGLQGLKVPRKPKVVLFLNILKLAIAKYSWLNLNQKLDVVEFERF
jgi:hypothetical protein